MSHLFFRAGSFLVLGFWLAAAVPICSASPTHQSSKLADNDFGPSPEFKQSGQSCGLTDSRSNVPAEVIFDCSALKRAGLLEGDFEFSLSDKAKSLGADLMPLALATVTQNHDPLIVTIFRSVKNKPWKESSALTQGQEVISGGLSASSTYCIADLCDSVQAVPRDGPSIVQGITGTGQCFWRFNGAEAGSVAYGQCQGDKWAVTLRRPGQAQPSLLKPSKA